MMEIKHEPTEAAMEMAKGRVGTKHFINPDTDLGRHPKECKSEPCESEQMSKNIEQKCASMELEVWKKKIDLELLESKFTELEGRKRTMDDEIEFLKKRNEELEETISRNEKHKEPLTEGKVMGRMCADLSEEKDEEDEILQLMIEQKVLECEKKKAETEAEVWKMKYKELETRLLQLEKRLCPSCDKHRLVAAAKSKVGTEERMKKGSFDVATRSTHVKMENDLVDCDKIIYPVTDVESSCFHQVKATASLQTSGTPSIGNSSKPSMYVDKRRRDLPFETELLHLSRVKKQLKFEEEGSPYKKIAPSTPGAARPSSVGVIDIIDSDDEPDTVHSNMNACGQQQSKMVESPDSALAYCLVKDDLAPSDNMKKTLFYHSDGEDMNGTPSISTPKRKRAANVVASESESDDDRVPISKLRKKLPLEPEMNRCSYGDSATGAYSFENFSESKARRHLVKLRKCDTKDGPKRNSPNDSYRSSIPINKVDEDDSSEEDDGSESEGDSLDGFIVDGSESSDAAVSDNSSCSNDASDGKDLSKNDDVCSETGDSSDGNMDYGEIMSRFRRNRDHSLRWEFEADMLAAFGKDDELCMKAVCALYRQQTCDERVSKGTIHSNQRGFSQCDAFRGTILAEFLTGGDPKGDVIKSVKQLQEFNPKGPALCRALATHYSKQLFAIYQNKEDPFFIPTHH